MLLPLFWLLALIGLALCDQPPLHDLKGYQAGIYGHQPSQTYKTFDISSPLFNYGTWRKDLVAGRDSSHILMTLRYRDAGPYLFRNDDLSLVYADTRFPSAMNAKVQHVKGVPYLTFWHGSKYSGHGKGYCVFYNDRYQLKYNVSVTGPAIRADLHECEVTDDDTVLLTAYEDKPFDLSPVGLTGNDMLADSCFQEIDIQTNERLFSWCASDHFDVGLSFQNFTRTKRGQYDDPTDQPAPPRDGVDVFHINSLQKVGH